jgi:hypothetical protein
VGVLILTAGAADGASSCRKHSKAPSITIPYVDRRIFRVVEKLVVVVRLSEAATSGLPGREGEVLPIHLEAMIVTPQGKPWPFSVELDTMEVERGHTRGTSTPDPERRTRVAANRFSIVCRSRSNNFSFDGHVVAW